MPHINKATQEFLENNTSFSKMGYEKTGKGIVLSGKDWKDVPHVPNPIQSTIKVELHEAKRAGTHLDLRIDIKGRIYDFAIARRTELPKETGVPYKAIRRHNHNRKYFETKSHYFPEGSYGHGHMSTSYKGVVDIIYADETKIEFQVLEGPYKGRYCIFTEKSPHIPESIIRMKDPEIEWQERMEFTTSNTQKERIESGRHIAEHKVDGANFMLKFNPKKGQNVLVSRRLSVKNEPIDRIDNMPDLKYFLANREFEGRVIHVEVVSEDHNVYRTSSLLNSLPSNSRQSQTDGPRLIAVIWDIEDEGNYEERRAFYKKLAKSSPRSDLRNYGRNEDRFLLTRMTNPKVLQFPESNLEKGLSPEEYSEYMKSKGYEGTIWKDLDGLYYGDKWFKDKSVHTENLVITGFKEGTGKYLNSLGAVEAMHPETGAITYVGTGFSDAERLDIWQHKEEYMGKQVVIDCHEITPNGVARGPRYKGVKP